MRMKNEIKTNHLELGVLDCERNKKKTSKSGSQSENGLYDLMNRVDSNSTNSVSRQTEMSVGILDI